jgi:ribonuclease HII
LAGPVVVCALIWPPERPVLRGVDDSKRLAPAPRARLAAQLRQAAQAWALGAASVAEIDRLNIAGATALAMRRALGRLAVRPDRVLVDGLPVRALGREHIAVVGGDARCFSIAAASIVAKVARDGLMTRLAVRYPAYGWERNAGYGTAAHRSALAACGLTAHHRRSFCAGK